MAKHKGIPSIRQRKNKDGKKIDLWECQLNLGRDEKTGKLKRVSVYGKTQKECKEKVVEALGQVQNQTFVEPNKMTLSQWLDTWLAEYKKDSVKPSTYGCYEYLVRVHLKDIGGVYLKDLKPEVIQKFYNDKVKSGLNPSTVQRIHIVLHAALKQAIINNKLVRNVAETTKLPKKKDKDMRVLTLEEQKKFMETVRTHRLGPAFLLSLSTGMRVGELLGLTWKNVNLKEGSIRVTQAISRVVNLDENDPAKTELSIHSPKTDSSRRTIPLAASMITELKNHRERQRKERKELGLSELYDGFVFASASIGTGEVAYKPIDPRNFTRLFYHLIDKAGIEKINLHALRHTFATRMLELGEHPKIVQQILGHKSITMTLDLYSHVSPELERNAVNKLDNLLQTNDTAQNK